MNAKKRHTENPSSWEKREPLLIMAIVGFLIALYLGLYQLHIFGNVWEPFFGNGTNKILHSSFSRSLPVPDGLLGAFGYLCDIILVSVGKQNRWRSKPWIVFLYSSIVALMALVSLFLLIMQAFILHSWCTLCLASAALSLLMVLPVYKEFLATFQFVKSEKEAGKPAIRAVEGR
jgi:uncharacterized membrane protein